MSLPTDRLGKLLPVLSSDKDGEVLAAVRAIDSALRKAGHDWHDLTSVVQNGRSSNVDTSNVDMVRALYQARIHDLQADVDRLEALAENLADRLNRTRDDRDHFRRQCVELETELQGVQNGHVQVEHPEYRSRSVKQCDVMNALSDPIMRGLSNRELARRLGVSPQTITNWKRKINE